MLTMRLYPLPRRSPDHALGGSLAHPPPLNVWCPVSLYLPDFCLPSRRRLLCLGDAAVHGYIGKLKADVSVVGFEHYFAQRVHRPKLDPLVASVAQRGGRTQLIGDPVVGAAEHQYLNELLEDHSIGYAGAVAAQRMVDLSFGQQGGKLLPDRLDEVWWERGHGFSPSPREAW